MAFRIPGVGCLVVMLGCASSPNVPLRLSFSGAASQAAFSDKNAVDLILQISNVPAGSSQLDVNRDGLPDVFGFPKACGSDFPAKCGFSLETAAEYDIADLPLGYLYKLEAWLRDSSGKRLYSASTQFANEGVVQTIFLTLEREEK